MVKEFTSHWEGSKKPISESIKDRIHPGPPLKQRLSNTIYRLQVISHRFNSDVARLEQRGKEFFEKCTEAQVAKDNERAVMYANECAEIRKMARIVLRSEIAIEQVMLRLETVRDFGDVAVQMTPVVSIVHSVKSQLAGIMPQVSYELGAIGETLNSLVTEVGDTMGTDYDMVASGEEAQQILREAGAIAEQKMSEKFPELPIPTSGLPTSEKEAVK